MVNSQWIQLLIVKSSLGIDNCSLDIEVVYGKVIWKS